jgi:hypothetical protein
MCQFDLQHRLQYLRKKDLLIHAGLSNEVLPRLKAYLLWPYGPQLSKSIDVVVK